eukprot:scaffold6373_cov124-Pinguiococcus_pyrenoidosus.AAC.1
MAELRRLVLVDQRHLRAVDHRQSLTQLLARTGCVAKAHALDAHIRRAERDQRWAAGAPTHVSQETIDGPGLRGRALLASVLPLLLARTSAWRGVRWHLLLGAFVRRLHARVGEASSALQATRERNAC